MICFVTPQGSYYEGERAHALDTQVPQRPSPDHAWSGLAWVAPDPAVILDRDANRAVDAVDRLQDRVLFRHENDIRELRTVINTLKAGAFTAAQSAQVDRSTWRDRLLQLMKAVINGIP